MGIESRYPEPNYTATLFPSSALQDRLLREALPEGSISPLWMIHLFANEV